MQTENEKLFQSIKKQKEDRLMAWFDEKIRYPEYISSFSEQQVEFRFKYSDLGIFEENDQSKSNMYLLSKLIRNKYGSCDMKYSGMELSIKIARTIKNNEPEEGSTL